MKYTNKYNLPQGIYDALVDDDYSIGSADYSISQLNSPPQQRRLIQLNSDNITVDISTEIWKLLGTSVHYILQKSQEIHIATQSELRLGAIRELFLKEENDPPIKDIKEILNKVFPVPQIHKNTLTEERIYMRLGGKVIGGKPDRIELHPNSIKIEDYKVTSVWKILKHDYRDWEFQLNAYALLADYNNIKVDSLQVNAILKDWKKFEFEQQRDVNYPEHPIAVVSIPLWNFIDTTTLLLNKISEHELLKSVTDAALLYSLRPCSNEDKWHGEDKYAVMKEGGKRASAVFDTDTEAWEYISGRADGVYRVEPRLGEDKRCEEFCLAKPFCAQYKAEHSNSIISPTVGEIDLGLLPSDSDVTMLRIEAVDKTKAILDGIITESNEQATDNEIKSSSATVNEVETLLESFHKKKKETEFNLDAFLEGN